MASLKAMSIADLDIIEVMEKELFGTSAWEKASYIQELEDNPWSHYEVVIENQEIVGYCGYFVLYENAEILTIGVAQEKQGRGYGRLMMEKMLTEAQKLGAQVMTLEVRVNNQRAIALYQDFGFEIVAVRPNYYKDGENAFLMVKRWEVN